MNELLRLRTALALAVSLGLALPGVASAADDIRGDDAAATEHSDDMYGEDTTAEDADHMRGGDTAVIEEDRQPLDEAREREPMAGAEPEEADEEGGPVRDAWVKSKLESSYAVNDDLSALDIDTDVERGHVTLSGTVASEDQRQMAEEVALGIEGVSAVDNQLMVEADTGTAGTVADADDTSATDEESGSAIGDSWVQSKLESSYAVNDDLSALDIDTEVQDGRVTLSGTVATEDQRQTAEEVALGIEGVSAVDNQLMVEADTGTAGTAEAVADTDSASGMDDDDSGSAVGDSWVQSKLESSYAVNDDLSALDIDTEVQDGRVTLSGTVATEDQRQTAEEVALGIEGVSAVDNQLMVEADTGTAGTAGAVADTDSASGMDDDDSGSAVGDAALTAKVKSKLIGDDSIEGTDIDVDTQGSVVTLSGRVSTEEQRTRALELAREVDDVQSVQDELVVSADD